MPRPMPPNVKALRAQHRKEDTEYFNARLNTMIKHKQHCLKMSKATDRKAAISCMTCCKRLQAIRVERRARDSIDG